MGDWRPLVKNNPIRWLLEPGIPSVQYYVMTDILGKSNSETEVKRAKQLIMEVGVVPQILSKQKNGGHWGKPEDFYMRSKYKGTVWNLIVLAEFGADGNDHRVKNACEFILKNSQDPESGGFSHLATKLREGDHHGIIPCLTGNMLWCLIRFGYLEDPRVQQGINWITSYLRFDDGATSAPKSWPYEKHEKCWGGHTCHYAVVKSLKALAEIPIGRRTASVKRTVEDGAEHLLRHHIYKRSHHLTRVSIPNWTEFGFPLMWNSDALEVLAILTRLGYRDSRMQEAVDLVTSKQDKQGRWKLDKTFNGRFLANIELEGKPSKWVTLNALRALKGYCE